jgi:predicted phage terminase large subunit-like protein
MGVDLASSERERADFTARVTTAEDEEGNFYVLSVYRDKREAHHAEFVLDGWMAYSHMALVIVESQQFQSTLIQEVMADYPRIPIEGKKADVDKVTRARSVAAKYEAHKVWHHSSLKDSAFEAELLSFPKGHDDMVDAMGYSFDLGSSGFFYGSVRAA